MTAVAAVSMLSPPTVDSSHAALSVVIVTPGGTDEIAATLGCLRAQTARDQLEIIVVGPCVENVTLGVVPFEQFAAARSVIVGEMTSLGGCLAAGIRVAQAPIVVCAEEHSYPEPAWAAALIEAHRGPWSAVGGVLKNANPRTSASWSSLFCCFGRAVAPAPAGETVELPGHHTAYKREALARYADGLDRCLEVEWVMQEDMRLSGARLYQEPAAISRHMNHSSLRSLLGSSYYGGRTFAANRAWIRKWSPRRRLLYTAAGPLLLVHRLRMSLLHVHRAKPKLTFKILPALALALTADTAGQAAGYALGPGQAPNRRLSFELYRKSHLSKRDAATE